MKLGFLGVGHIASAMVQGLYATAPPEEQIYLSPRGRETAARLSATYPRVQVAQDNQGVVDAADIVFLCVRPEVAEEVLRALSFAPRHLLISLVAFLPLDRVRTLAGPATVVRAVPIPSVQRCESPTAIYPEEPRARALFDRLGTALPVDDESAFNSVAAATSLIVPTYAVMEEVTRWLIQQGVAEVTARRFVVGQFRSMTAMAAEAEGGGLEQLGTRAATPGGLNEQALSLLRRSGALQAFSATLDAVLERIVARGKGNT